MVDYIISDQGSLTMIFLGGGEEKIYKKFIKDVSYIHIKIYIETTSVDLAFADVLPTSLIKNSLVSCKSMY